ncbi:MAG: hypothetical protein E4H44_00220 [Candidatus Aminicenantes bacterium]|nr:MAG: hypothetical protein E4H44_00220 [Candidatus Aminicenantes bacterium]
MKAFSTAGRAPEPAMEGAAPITFDIDGEEVTAYPPTSGQMAMMIADQSEHRDVADSVAGIIDFCDGILDDKGKALLRRRLLDRDDPFDMSNIQDILEYLIEEWSNHPTQSSSVSSVSRSNGGRRSKAS